MHNFSDLYILIIEDDDQVRTSLRYILQAFGVRHVFEARNGTEGMHFLNSSTIKLDAVLCDWNMPCISGLTLLQSVRDAHNDLPFLMISGRNDMESVIQAKQAGVSAYLPKPINPGQLESKLRSLTR
jgi:two-component system, chemotaxis family, chemotaxis protein CheY